MVHAVMVSHTWLTQLPVKHLLFAEVQSICVTHARQFGRDSHWRLMQLPVKHASFMGLQSICFAHGLQFGTRMHSALMQSPVKHGSMVCAQSSAWTQGPPLDELDVLDDGPLDESEPEHAIKRRTIDPAATTNVPRMTRLYPRYGAST